MKSVLKFIVFLAYTLSIFIVQPVWWLAICACVNLGLMIALKINLKKAVIALFKLSVLILIIVIFNILLANLQTAVLTGIKLILVWNSTYIFITIFSYRELTKTIEILAEPVKIFRGNPKDVALMACIGIAFLPILGNEIKQIRECLIVKGLNVQGINLIKNLKLVLRPFLISVLERVNEIEMSIKSKGYQE